MRKSKRHSPSNFRNWVAYLIPMGLLGLAITLQAVAPPVLTQLKMTVFDKYQSLKPRVKAPLPVQVVDIDEESLTQLGQWPWPRYHLAKLVDKLAESGAAAIVIDVLFSEPDRLSPESVVELLPNWPEYQIAKEAAKRALAFSGGFRNHDETLAHALSQSNSVLGFALADNIFGELPKTKAGMVNAGDPPNDFLLIFTGGIFALPVLADAARGYGALSLVPDSDGVVRRAPILVSVDGQVLPTVDAEALRVAQSASTYIVKSTNASGEQSFGSKGGVVGVKIGALSVPTDSQGRIWIRYADQISQPISARQLLSDDFDPAALAGKIVLLGSSAAGLSRPQPTPVLGVAPALQIRAQILETLISGEFLYQPDWAKGAEILSLVLLGLLLIWLLPRWGALWCALIGLTAIGAAIGGSWILFAQYNALISPIYFAVVIMLIYLSQSLQVYLASEKEKQEVRGAFGRYLSPVLVEQLANDPTLLRLGGEMRQVTVLFCDIRGFTRISEQLAPEELTQLLNRFLTPLTEVILNEQGTIDKYMGDCIMAFWNAPMNVLNHEYHACRSALQMLEALGHLNRSMQHEAQGSGRTAQALRMGIGINSGSALAGNLGSEQRFDYSILGDSVNLASRLEGQSKTYGVEVLISEDTFAKASGLAFLELDLLQVVGKTEPVRIFTLVGDESVARTASFKKAQALQLAMLDAYRARNWDQALELIDQLRESGPESAQGYFSIFGKRIRGFQANPPGPDWDGVEKRLTK
ncbi:MAG: adenylate/guanylate cyclase domain-containing protein [Arenicellales bacterium]